MGQITYISDSAEAERRLMATVDDILSAGIDIEAKILSSKCSTSDLRETVLSSLADIFIVGANQATTLSCCVAAYTNRPVIAVLLESEDGQIPNSYGGAMKELSKKGAPLVIMSEEDIKTATQTAIEIITNKAAQYRAIS
ncbi:AIR carboxylase family protein [Candidatus Saccharibacteria bacterium]|nr:AIR carboxylase family protein [Candidatus Saccharibacteria bacterium]